MEEMINKFKISEFDEFLGETIIGSFLVKQYLTPLDVIKADSIFRELLGGVNPLLASNEAKEMAFMVSQLNVRVIESPSWFKNEDSYHGGHLSPKLLGQILNKSVSVQAEYQKVQQNKYEQLKAQFEKKMDSGRVTRKEETNASETPLNASSDVFEDELE